MVHSLFASGAQTVALDATNTTIKRRNEWRCVDYWVRDLIVFNTPKMICIERALQNDQPYLVSVIERMAEQYEPVTAYELSDEESITFNPHAA